LQYKVIFLFAIMCNKMNFTNNNPVSISDSVAAVVENINYDNYVSQIYQNINLQQRSELRNLFSGRNMHPLIHFLKVFYGPDWDAATH
jgi:hypothetical protein